MFFDGSFRYHLELEALNITGSLDPATFEVYVDGALADQTDLISIHPSGNSGDVTGVNVEGNYFTSVGHGLSDGDAIVFEASEIAGGLLEDKRYYVIDSTANTHR